MSIFLGIKNAIIVDSNSQRFRNIPKVFGELLLKYEQIPFSDMEINPEDFSIFKSNILELQKLNYLFINKGNLQLAKRSDNWSSSSLISNAIFIYSPSWFFAPINLSDQLKQLGCESIELRIEDKIDLQELKKVLIHLNKFECLNISVHLVKGTLISKSDLIDLFQLNLKLISISVFEAETNEKIAIDRLNRFIYFKENTADIHKSCGNINPGLFNSHHQFITEAQHNNSCLNRKIAIDSDGNIKNCPSMATTYGNINDTTLIEALDQPNFKKLWNINKDKILVCKDCEFRHICTDCRAYVEDPEDILSKPLKCGYNPYTGEWNKWSTNPLKQKGIDFYGMREIMNSVD